MKRFSAWWIFVPAILFLAGCSGQKEMVLKSGYDYYKAGMKFFKKKKWDKAIEKFDVVLLNYPGSEYVDDAKFYTGECYLKKKEYLLAINEYEELISRFPYSDYVERAAFKIGYSYYKLSPKFQLDQEYTRKAIQSLQDFIDTYPDSKFCKEAEKLIYELRNKLARKLYEAGKLYIKLREYNAALIYFDLVLESYYDTDWADDAELGKAYCYVKLRDFDKYEEILAKYNDKESPDVQKMVEKLKRVYQRELKKIGKEKRKR
ncbi:MAG: outer membrane protein assembly factor BamD [Candidatus Marinimicrobia bacterium]|nr:outer membrane protein assembly factor BamD [Candidatus Neomarinimicrobiota bacterium]